MHPEDQRGSRCVQTGVAGQRRTALRIGALLLGCAGSSGFAAPQQPAPEPPAQQHEPAAEKTEEKAKPRPRRLVLDIEKHVEKKLAEEPPRFETSIEVVAKSPQMLLERFFGGVDLECGPGGGGAPSVEEMREHRPHAPPTADLMALAMALAGKVMGKVKGNETPRYFLYAVKRSNAVNYALREEKVPDAWFYNFPGVTFELVESFPDRDSAVRAWRRMERGFGTPTAPKVDALAPQWATAPCRPRR
jgi:hypothetical protein